jgi:Ca2+-binding EF-hand superfamily protein
MSNMHRQAFLSAAIAVLSPALFAPVLVAQPPQNQPRVFLLALDTDHDGQLSAAEIAAASASLLTLDKNHDGQITPDEYAPRFQANSPVSNELYARLMAMDANKDGVLTVDEVPERMQPMFKRGDTDHDGKLTGDEIRAMANAQADPQGRPVGRNNASVQLRTDPIANALDVDHDGIFSAAEIASAPGALKTLDKNADGILSADELRVRQQTPAERAAHSMDEWDGDRDGFLIKGEMPDRVQANFEAMDLNHDGKVDLEELTTFMATQPMGRGPGGPPTGAGERPGDMKPPAERMPDNNASPAR